MAERAAILLSVRSPHVERLLDGSKTVELRRRPIRVEQGTVALLYAAGERKALVGSVVIESVEALQPSELWARYRTRARLTRDEFDAYFAEAAVGYAVVVTGPRVLPQPIGLRDLRKRWGDFSTPQTYRRLDCVELGSILNGERRLIA